ncbi:hypothetical protein ABZ400_22065 [Streptomyces sp. NPDC005897]|uniref:hypothetical protein n=1 Tax=Streptomyces sp. NPDC005897 TaxID=3157081 RepID=UPI0033D0F1E1
MGHPRTGGAGAAAVLVAECGEHPGGGPHRDDDGGRGDHGTAPGGTPALGPASGPAPDTKA